MWKTRKTLTTEDTKEHRGASQEIAKIAESQGIEGVGGVG
jgi:hypothetical protein